MATPLSAAARSTAATGLIALTLVGCSAGSDSGTASTTATASSSATTSPSAPTSASAPAPVSPPTTAESAAGVVIAVRIAGGVVTPTNERVDAKVGEKITINVDSDVAEELHVHSVPDHEFEILPVPGQVFSFTVDLPGQVAIELHHSDKTVATLVVR